MAHDTNSIVDFLRSLGQDSSFAARRSLWARFDPTEEYAGTGTQNTRLLAYLKLGDLAPNLILEKANFNQGEIIFATVRSSAAVLIENEFGQQSIQAEPGQRVNLGTVTQGGVYPLRVRSQLIGSEMALFVIPRDSQGSTFDVAVWDGAAEYPTIPVVIELEAGDEDLLDRFINGLEQAGIFEAALTPAAQAFFQADRWYGMGFDVAIGGLVAIVSPVQGGIYILKQSIPQLTDFSVIYISALIDLMNGLTDDEKTRLKAILTVVVNVTRIGRNVKKLKDADNICDQLQAIGSMGNPTVKLFQLAEPQPGDVAMAGAFLRNSVTKSVTMVCQIIKHAP